MIPRRNWTVLGVAVWTVLVVGAVVFAFAACDMEPATPTVAESTTVPPSATIAEVAVAPTTAPTTGPVASPVVTDDSAVCIACHTANSPKMVEAYNKSKHAAKDVTCLSCHTAEEGDWDATDHNGFLVATHPTPKDCATCHEDAVAEFARSKHGAMSTIKLAASFDRTVFEPTIATKHGCQQCHNIGHFWPDQSVGECDACHPKHSFDVAVARNPFTCGECHMGPDHSNIETWVESKHGNIFMTYQSKMDLGYESGTTPVPFDAPGCSTCHMDAAPGVPATHDVGERLALETQAPWTTRTTEAWGGGETWQEKRTAMKKVCFQCHASPFVDRYFLTGDLTAFQYNEIFREAQRWLGNMKDAGIIVTPGFEGLAAFGIAGYDEEPEEMAYHMWHHEGRLYRHGALMMGADFTQWHGIFELQKAMVEIIRYGAEHGLPEAEAWMKSSDPAKFWLYPFYDVPGSAWGIDTLVFRKSEEHTTQILMNRDSMPDYWDRARANVEALYKAGLLSDDQWSLWQKLYEDRERENGNIFPLPPDYDVHKKADAEDGKAATVVKELKLPAGGGWKYGE